MSQVYGNSEVVELLEVYLDAAKKNQFGSVAIAMTGHPNVAAIDYAGEIALEEPSLEAVGILFKRLKSSIDNWKLPPRDESLGEDFVCYNIANGPLGFDFLVWLVDAEMTRIATGRPAPLKVAFWRGKDSEQRMKLDGRETWEMNVFRPCMDLIGAVYDERAVLGHAKQMFLTKDIIRMFSEGIKVPKLKAKNDYALPSNCVTITLRECDHWPHRNSAIEEWKKFAQELNEDVIFIRDTSRADEPLEGFVTCPIAAKNLDARMALYERSKANLFVSNGPVALALFSDKPWLQFVKVEPDNSGYGPNTKQFWKERSGVAVGEQFPWSSQNQRIIWQDDKYENIKSAYEALDLKG
jgi:hypothetical protein